MSAAFCDGIKIGFIIFSIEGLLHSLCFIVERCIVFLYSKHVVCYGIYVTSMDGGILPVNDHVSAMDVNAKGSY